MDTHTTVPVHGHSTYEEDPLHQHGHGVALQSGGHEEHHEKKSVLKKVKAKAKKIKETITGHGHHDDHDHHNEHDDEEEDDDEEEEEEEEEIVKDPEVHGAPMYESAARREFARRDDVNLGKPKVVRSEQVGSVQLEADSHALKGPFHGVAPPANYQTKVADPTGRGGEVDVDPTIRQFGKMEVDVDPEDRDKFPVTKTQTNPPNTQSVPGSLNTSNSNEPTPHHESSSYTDKISSATCVIADKAISAKNVVASKLGYGGGNGNVTAPDANKDQHHSGGTGTGIGTGVTDYGRQIAATVTDKLAPVYGKVAEAGSAVASKIQGTGTETHRGTGSHSDTDVNRGIETHTGAGTAGAVTDTHPTTGAGAGASAGVRIKGYLAEKLKPGEEDKALSEVISDALHKRKGEEEERKDGVDRAMGKVTESEQVARRLGTDTDESGGTGNESPGKSYVNRLKGAMTSWWGKGGETDPSQAIQDNGAHGTLGDQMSGGGVKDEGDGHENVGERKLQGYTS